MNKLTPNLIVSAVEDCLPFWVDRLGFEKTVEVPDGDRLGFAILKRGAVEVMVQSRRSLENDMPAVAAGPHRAVLYVELADLAPIRKALAGYPDIVEERTAFYGARELIVRDPAGHVVFFASHEENP